MKKFEKKKETKKTIFNETKKNPFLSTGSMKKTERNSFFKADARSSLFIGGKK